MPHLHGCTAFNAGKGSEERAGARQSRREIDSSRFALYIKKKTLYFNLNPRTPTTILPKNLRRSAAISAGWSSCTEWPALCTTLN